jgi:hypothetical protein
MERYDYLGQEIDKKEVQKRGEAFLFYCQIAEMQAFTPLQSVTLFHQL